MKKYGFSPENWLALRNEIRSILIRTATSVEQTISYSELAETVESASLKPFSQPLFAVLTELSEEEDAAGRGMLSAVVIRKDRRKPRKSGFIRLAAKLERDVSNARACWDAEIERVCTYWSAHSTKITHLS